MNTHLAIKRRETASRQKQTATRSGQPWNLAEKENTKCPRQCTHKPAIANQAKIDTGGRWDQCQSYPHASRISCCPSPLLEQRRKPRSGTRGLTQPPPRAPNCRLMTPLTRAKPPPVRHAVARRGPHSTVHCSSSSLLRVRAVVAGTDELLLSLFIFAPIQSFVTRKLVTLL